MSATQILANKLLDHQVGKTAYAMPTVWVGLSSTTPNIDGVTGINEPSTGSYARVATTGATWTAASLGATSNAAVITFPQATANWVASADLTYGLIYDAATAGNLLGFGALTVPKNCLTNDTLSIPIGDLDITLS